MARKCQDQDDAVEQALQEVEEVEEKYLSRNRVTLFLHGLDMFLISFWIGRILRFKQDLVSLQDTVHFLFYSELFGLQKTHIVILKPQANPGSPG